MVLPFGAPATRPAAAQLAEAIKILLCITKVIRPLLGDMEVEAVFRENPREVTLPLLLWISLMSIPPGWVPVLRAQSLLLQAQYNAFPLSTDKKCIGRAWNAATVPILRGIPDAREAPSEKPQIPNELLPCLSRKQIEPLLGVHIGPWLLFLWPARPARPFDRAPHS